MSRWQMLCEQAAAIAQLAADAGEPERRAQLVDRAVDLLDLAGGELFTVQRSAVPVVVVHVDAETFERAARLVLPLVHALQSISREVEEARRMRARLN